MLRQESPIFLRPICAGAKIPKFRPGAPDSSSVLSTNWIKSGKGEEQDIVRIEKRKLGVAYRVFEVGSVSRCPEMKRAQYCITLPFSTDQATRA